MSLNVEQEQKLQWAIEQFERGELQGEIGPFLDTFDIGRRLKEAGLDRETRKAFANWFVRRGLDEGWLADELGLS